MTVYFRGGNATASRAFHHAGYDQIHVSCLSKASQFLKTSIYLISKNLTETFFVHRLFHEDENEDLFSSDAILLEKSNWVR